MNKIAWVVIAAFLGLMLLMGLTCVSYNNSFVKMDEEIKGAWAQVENQLKRRADLIPNLAETVKGFAAHEQEVFGKIAEARSKLMNAKDVPTQIAANNELSGLLGRRSEERRVGKE